MFQTWVHEKWQFIRLPVWTGHFFYLMLCHRATISRDCGLCWSRGVRPRVTKPRQKKPEHEYFTRWTCVKSFYYQFNWGIFNVAILFGTFAIGQTPQSIVFWGARKANCFRISLKSRGAHGHWTLPKFVRHL